jgi:hypothetical protein
MEQKFSLVNFITIEGKTDPLFPKYLRNIFPINYTQYRQIARKGYMYLGTVHIYRSKTRPDVDLIFNVPFRSDPKSKINWRLVKQSFQKVVEQCKTNQVRDLRLPYPSRNMSKEDKQQLDQMVKELFNSEIQVSYYF